LGLKFEVCGLKSCLKGLLGIGKLNATPLNRTTIRFTHNFKPQTTNFKPYSKFPYITPRMSQPDLNEIVKRLKASDQDAFKIVFDLWQGPIFNFLLFKTKDAARADDLLQEAFLRLWNSRANLKESQSLKNYLYTIADNLLLNEIRHDKVVARHKSETRVTIFSNTENPEFILEEKEYRDQLEKAIMSLPEKPRIVFLMSRVEDLSYQEIADRLSISVKTVESHMVKALKLLREDLSKKL
jgi:RNA polymerase sigma-70 factor (ECF subfamily)